MTVRTSAGATLGVSAAAPATFNKVGWEAIVPTLVGEITDMGEFGREYSLVTHNPLASRATIKKKGSYNEGQVTLSLGLDNKDAGQILLKTAEQSDSDYFFCITLQSGDKYFFPAQVMSFKTKVGGVNDITTATVTLEITSVAGAGVFEDLLP